MDNKFDKTIGEMLKAFPLMKEILAVYLYGSVARGDYSPRHSDLDLLVIMDKTSVPEKTRYALNKALIPIGLRNGVKVHAEYQGTKIRAEDQTIMKKMIEEGKVIYSAGSFSFSYGQLGLGQYIIYHFSAKEPSGKAMLSKALHGHSSWYYNKGKKVVKEYKGILDGNNMVSLGKGVIMVSKKVQKDVETVFDRFGADYRIIRIVYA
jgi:predicted nucleotidyltransferase